MNDKIRILEKCMEEYEKNDHFYNMEMQMADSLIEFVFENKRYPEKNSLSKNERELYNWWNSYDNLLIDELVSKIKFLSLQ